jgi:phage terminase large subunit GpA-like protein
MILFFGTRPGKTEVKELDGVVCPHCEQIGTLSATHTPNYVHLFWLPLFRIAESRYAECSHCKRVFYREEFTAEMERAAESQ